MINRRHASSGQAARTPPTGGRQVRRDWMTAVELGLKGGVQDLPALIVALRELTPENFPVGSWMARQMAGAFLILARAFVRPEASEEARTACAGFLKTGAGALDTLLNAQRTEAAQATWNRGRADD